MVAKTKKLLFKKILLERLHKCIFRFDAEVQIYGWSWTYWWEVDLESISPEGDYIIVTDGIFCFQRRYYSLKL